MRPLSLLHMTPSRKQVRLEGFAAIIVYAIIAAISFAQHDRTADGVEVCLCLTCANAVVTRGTVVKN
jgi:hypothetical protein